MEVLSRRVPIYLLLKLVTRGMSHGRLRRVDIHDDCPDGLGDGIFILDQRSDNAQVVVGYQGETQGYIDH